jgi:endonuclease/exonuclease/phosphatase (EEP) superfamily protein YafD
VIAEPREDNFGIALFSRLPSTNSELIELGKAGVPSIATTIFVGGQEVFLLGTHPLPPGSAEYARLRNEQLQEIAALIRRHDMAAIVLGDLNCTPWSPYFTDLIRDSGLKNASQQRGLFGSWPAWLPLARIPLDHGLVSPTIRIIQKWTGPPVGSDHLPLVLELQISTEDHVHVPPGQKNQAHD